MKKNLAPRFSLKTFEYILKASRQKNPLWLERNRAEYERLVLHPLQALAAHLKSELGPRAPGYHFPLKGIGRLKRAANRVEDGGGLYRSWLHYSAAVPRKSRYETNPNLFFLIDPEDRDDSVLVAGGLYMPSSPQLRKLREAVAQDATPFERLFATKDFARSFPGGFSRERTATRPPRGFDPTHPKMDWLKLQAFFVWRGYSRREFVSPDFFALVARDLGQVLRLNAIMEPVLEGRPLASTGAPRKGKSTPLIDRLAHLEGPARPMDF